MSAGDFKVSVNVIHVDGPNEAIVVEMHRSVEDRHGKLNAIGDENVHIDMADLDEDSLSQLEMILEKIAVLARKKCSLDATPRGFFRRFVDAAKIFVGR